MAIQKRRRPADHDSPARKKQKTNTSFTIGDFMKDFPAMMGPVASENDSLLPSTVLSIEEMQHGSQNIATFRSTFNIKLPIALEDHSNESAQNAPYRWMKNQYSHCIVPELGEEYDFAFESPTFYTLRDLHNARVRIRDENYLPDYIICSLASRWVCLEEKDRPASQGYLANGEIFVATCLPLSQNEDALEQYFEMYHSMELSAHHYIPLSKYSVHFVGEPQLDSRNKIQSVLVGSVLIRKTRTGDLVHIDTGAPASRMKRARTAGNVLKAWLQFQKAKSPETDLGPISNSEPLILGVDTETHPTLRSIHAIVSASLFLRRGIKNWGDVKAFKLRGKPTSTTVANYALQNISGWLGLKSLTKNGQVRSKKPTGRPVNTFKDNYEIGALFGRQVPAPVSERIASAQKGEPPVYNEEAILGDNASDEEDDHSESSSESSHDSVDDTTADGVDKNEFIVVADQLNNSSEVPNDENANHKEPVDHRSVSWGTPINKRNGPVQEQPNHEKSSDDDFSDESSTDEGSHKSDPIDKDVNSERPDNNDEDNGKATGNHESSPSM